MTQQHTIIATGECEEIASKLWYSIPKSFQVRVEVHNIVSELITALQTLFM